jgi:hypothetical protein
MVQYVNHTCIDGRCINMTSLALQFVSFEFRTYFDFLCKIRGASPNSRLFSLTPHFAMIHFLSSKVPMAWSQDVRIEDRLGQRSLQQGDTLILIYPGYSISPARGTEIVTKGTADISLSWRSAAES